MILTLYTMNLCLLVAVSKIITFIQRMVSSVDFNNTSLKCSCSHHICKAVEFSE